jgi:uncharacterized spore protein YtfJ
MQHIKELLELVTGKLETVAQSDAVVGEPIELGGVTLVVLTRISVGFGMGGGEGEGQGFGPGQRAGKKTANGPQGKGVGGGTGGGAKVRPVGVAIFSADGVEILPIKDKKGLLDRLFDKVPELVDIVKEATEGMNGSKSIC